VGTELHRTIEEMRIGVDIDEAMEHTADRIRVPDFRFFAVALRLQRRTGGGLAETLTNLSNIIRRRKEIRQKARALTAEPKAAALLSALHLWRIGRQEDRRDRLMELRGAVVDRAVREQRPRWYQRIGSIVAASPAVGTAEQHRLLGVLAAAGIRGHYSLSGFVASKLCSAFITAA